VPGKVYLTGAGPGDPKLITLRAIEALQRSDVIIYDRLVSPQLFMYARPTAKLIYAGKQPERHTMRQEEINRLLVEYASQGLTVMRLKGGDPTIFGRVGEEAEALAERGIEYEIIPGVSSVHAVPAYAGIPITHRDHASSFCVLTGHEKPEKLATSLNWEHLAHAADTLIFLMGVGRLEIICEQLMKHGRSPATPVALIRWGTRPEQQTLVGTLADIVAKVRESGFSSPAVIVVGDVVALRDKLSWIEKRPLFGKRVLVTRARAQASEMIRRMEELGGEAVALPVLEIEPVQDEARLARLDQALAQLAGYSWIVFTSVNGVEHFFRRMRERRIDVRQAQGARFAAVGPATASALLDRGIVPEELPGRFQAEGLADYLLARLKPGDRVLIPRSSIARDVLPEALQAAGYEVTAVDVYDNKPVRSGARWVVDLLEAEDIHIVTFASSSSVHHLIEALEGYGVRHPEELVNRCKIVCIGPITEAAARERGLAVTATAGESTIEAMIELLCTI